MAKFVLGKLLSFHSQHTHDLGYRASLIQRVGRSIWVCQWGRESMFVSVVIGQFWERGGTGHPPWMPPSSAFVKQRAWTRLIHPALWRSTQEMAWHVLLTPWGSQPSWAWTLLQHQLSAPGRTSAPAFWGQRKKPTIWLMWTLEMQLVEKHERAAVSGLDHNRAFSS